MATWLESIGLSKYQSAFDANGVSDLQTLAGLEPSQLKALGVRGRRENPFGPEETSSDLDVISEALRGLRVAMGQGAAGAGGGARVTEGRRRKGGAGGGREGGRYVSPAELEEEDAMFKRALEESLAEYQSSNSASGSAPGSRNGSRHTSSQPGTATSLGDPAFQEADMDMPRYGISDMSAAVPAARRTKDGKKREKSVPGALIGLGKVRGFLEVCALSAPGKGSTRTYCVLNGSRLKMWWGNEVRDENLDPPDKEVLMDGKCVDALQEAGQISTTTLFVRRTMFGVSPEDLQLTVLAETTFVEWLQRLQASAYLFSLGGASVNAPVAGLVLRVLSIVNASSLFQNLSLAVIVAKQSGQVLETLTEVQLAQPSSRDMRFEIYREIKPPSDPVCALYFELRYFKNGRVQPTKYWATVSCQDMEQGERVLQVYKAPVEYNVQRQRLQPKKESTLEITFTA